MDVFGGHCSTYDWDFQLFRKMEKLVQKLYLIAPSHFWRVKVLKLVPSPQLLSLKFMASGVCAVAVLRSWCQVPVKPALIKHNSPESESGIARGAPRER